MSAPTLLRGRAVAADDYVRVDDESPIAIGARAIVSLARWLREHDDLATKAGAVGVALPCDRLPSDVPDLDRLALVAIELPRFTDGRAYSIARMLRDRYGFRGELRATGHVLRDQLRYLERCGFDAFELAPGQSPERAIEAFAEHTTTYQAAADTPLPHYRRR
jgi:uncharacterized protein (DUF934 family)